jgi:hypothetical protein
VTSQLNRKSFLRKVALGSVAAASLPAFFDVAAALADDGEGGQGAGGQPLFHFVSLSQANTVDGIAHPFFMRGDGRIGQRNVVGSGMSWHADANTPVPRTLLESGSWKAKRLIEYHPIGTYGSQAAGFLDVEIDLVRDFPSPAVIPALLEVVCNGGFAGLSNPGKDEGSISRSRARSSWREAREVGMTRRDWASPCSRLSTSGVLTPEPP